MPTDPYDNPAFAQDDFDNVTFTSVGDQFHGSVLTVEAFKTKFGDCLKYKVLDDASGEERSMLAGSKNLLGQLVEARPRRGDHLDIELIELRPSAYGNPLKVFEVVVKAGSIIAESKPTQATPTGTSDEDLFAQ